MKIKDIEYIVTNMANLSGVPVRIYKNKKKIYYYSLINLPKDPIIINESNVFSSDKHIYYFVNSYYYYYGIVSFDDYKLVVGPTRQIPISNQEIMNFALDLEIHQNEIDDFKNGIKSIVELPLSSLLQMLSMMNFVFNKGEKLSLEDIQITDAEQEKLISTLEKESTDAIISSIEGTDKYPHNSYNIEQTIMDYIRKGDVSSLKDYFKKIPAVRSGITSADYFKQVSNIFTVTVTLVSRAAIRGGLDIEESLSLSDKYLKKCELEKSVDNIVNLQYRMVIDYAERVKKIKFGDSQSKLVSNVINYIRNHLSESITVSDIASSVFLSRSRLSVLFKQETGLSVGDFVTKQKIDEAKRLLRYSDKSTSSISMYLGFSSQSHFNRVFKQQVTLTPNEYRKKYSL